MSYSSILKTLAANAEQTVGKLAEELRTTVETEQALAEAAEAWKEAMADGSIDASEMAHLKPLFDKAGIGAALADPSSVEASLRKAQREVSKGAELRQIDLNLALQQTLTFYQGASDALRREGDVYDNIVANLRA